MKKVAIKIFSDQKQLHATYFRLFKKKGKVRAWYLFRENTIYVNVRDLFAGMLAHEMAHAVIEHYFKVRIPTSANEILARYVDKHLFD